jgi:hypothetical protein
VQVAAVAEAQVLVVRLMVQVEQQIQEVAAVVVGVVILAEAAQEL